MECVITHSGISQNVDAGGREHSTMTKVQTKSLLSSVHVCASKPSMFAKHSTVRLCARLANGAPANLSGEEEHSIYRQGEYSVRVFQGEREGAAVPT